MYMYIHVHACIYMYMHVYYRVALDLYASHFLYIRYIQHAYMYDSVHACIHVYNAEGYARHIRTIEYSGQYTI